MKPRETAYIRQLDPMQAGNAGFFGAPGGEFGYPGLGGGYPYGGGFPGGAQGGLPGGVPAVTNPGGGGGLGGLGSLFGGGSGSAAGGSGGGLGALGGVNFNQIKGFVDKMGGIDGIVGTMTRVQKVVSSFQQMAPMLKLLMGSFGGKAAAKAIDDDGDLYRPRRKRARRKGGKRPTRKYKKASSTTWRPKNGRRR